MRRTEKETMMSRLRWEYKIVEGSRASWKGDTIRRNSEAILNKLGSEGWECYAVNAQTSPSVFYLKRER